MKSRKISLVLCPKRFTILTIVKDTFEKIGFSIQRRIQIGPTTLQSHRRYKACLGRVVNMRVPSVA